MTVLERLYAVQQIDSAIDRLGHRRAQLPELRRQRELDAALGELRRRRQEITHLVQTLDAEGSKRNDELTAISKRRGELDRRLKSSSVPREVQGFADELAVLAERQGAIEDVELDAMEQVETLEAEAARLDAGLATVAEERAAVVAVLTTVEAEIAGELEALRKHRPASLDGIDAGLLARYSKMRDRLNGVAVAHLDKNRCDGCHLVISATELERIRREPDDALVECEHCGRLLLR